MSENLFGDYDAAEVPDDPFYVAPDTYLAEVTQAARVKNEENGRDNVVITWTVREDDSPYNGNNVADWKRIYPDVPKEELTAPMRKDLSRLKSRLLEMHVPEEEMNGLLDHLDDLVGIEAYITVSETPDRNDPTKKWTNITKVRIED